MKFGYSISLRKYIHASVINYNGCKKFFICCPNCREPVFKGVRTDLKKQENHYLSHYKNRSQTNIECELRVAAMNVSVSHSLDHTKKGQSLVNILKMLNDFIDRDSVVFWENDPDEEQFRKQVMTKLEESKVLRKYEEQLAEWANENELLYNFDDFNNQIQNYFGGYLGYDSTENISSNYVEIAYDIWRYLLTNSAIENFHHLFIRGYAILLSRLLDTTYDPNILQKEHLLTQALQALTNTDEESGDLIIKLMEGNEIEMVFGIKVTNLLEGFREHLVDEMIGVLSRLPYDELEELLDHDSSESNNSDRFLTKSISGIEDLTSGEIEEVIFSCLPINEQIIRENLLHLVAKKLGVKKFNRKVRRSINQPLFKQITKKKLQYDQSSGYVWRTV